MTVEVPFGDATFPLEVPRGRRCVIVAQSRAPDAGGEWEDVVEEAMRAPIEARPIREQRLHRARVAVVTDDWGRPTPAHRIIPLILRELAPTGVEDGRITFVTASGMHDPMSDAELRRKLGDDTVNRYACVSHDGGDWDMLAFVGVSAWGTPMWVNRFVAEADYRIGLGRVFPHVTHGYEGGYKLILPGVAGFDSILRDHSFNFSEDSVPGVHVNPSRIEADQIGRMVGFDFLINVVVNVRSEPVRAFAGAVEPVHQRAIEFGDREVWGAETGGLADVTIASHGGGRVPTLGFDPETLRRACAVTRPGGTVIMPTAARVAPIPDWRDGELASDDLLDRLGRKEFGPRLEALSFAELMRLHERRDWPLSRREIQWRAKAIRGEFYRRRWMRAANEQRVVFTARPQEALEAALERSDPDALVVIIPDGATTLPKTQLHQATA
jgi:nickel-dependent lactate racemase